MLKQYESEIERKVCALALLDEGVFSIKISKAKGYPDRLFFIPGGVPLFIEFKAKGKPAQPHQLVIHERLHHAGYKVEVHDDAEEALAAIRRAKLEAAALYAQGGAVAAGTPGGCALFRPRVAQNKYHVGGARDIEAGALVRRSSRGGTVEACDAGVASGEDEVG